MDNDIKRRASHRTKIIAGQVNGLQKMIDTDQYCMDILTQSLAIQKSLSSLNKLVLENHIVSHVVDMLRSDDEAERLKALDELMKLYELHNVRASK